MVEGTIFQSRNFAEGDSLPRHILNLVTPLAIVLVFAGCRATPSGYDPDPIDTSQDPVQEALEDAPPMEVSRGGYDFVLTPKASYIIRGKVLGRENYHGGWNALLSPCDVAMAWGELLKGDLYKKLDWSQSGRWCFWQYGPGFTQSDSFVSRYSSNNHIIPATKNVERAAKSLHAGYDAELTGKLVFIKGKKGDFNCWWNSSLSRSDTGNGSCEVLYLERLKTKDYYYE